MNRSKQLLPLLAAALTLCTARGAQPSALDLDGKPLNPLESRATVTVMLFARTDCPITNRYAPELQRIGAEFRNKNVRFWIVYPDRDESVQHIKEHLRDYNLPGQPLMDPQRVLVNEAHATVAPEVAVFNASGKLMYHGRIDDKYVDIGKTRPAAQVHDLEDAIAAVLAGKPVAHPETRAVGCSLLDVQ